MSAEFMVICKKILFRNCVIVSLFVFTYNTWAQCNNNIKIMRKYESEGKYTVRNWGK
ncbi:protein YhhH, partial [Escherichia coli]|nr:protein YhhH [Escherichia coli]